MESRKKRIAIIGIAILCLIATVFVVLAVALNTEGSCPTLKIDCEKKMISYTGAEVKGYRDDGDETTYPKYGEDSKAPEGYLFAGWYRDKECEINPLGKGAIEDTDEVWALFVPDHILNIKAQVPSTLINSVIEESDVKTKIQFVTSVDSLNYKYVGFDVSFTLKGKDYNFNHETRKVYSTLKAGGETVWPDKVYCNLSKYFMTCIVGTIPENYYDDFPINVHPYWITQDGEKVYGKEVTKSIGECCKKREVWVTEGGTNKVDYGSRENPYGSIEYARRRLSDNGKIYIKNAFDISADNGTVTIDSVNGLTGLPSKFVNGSDYRLEPASEVVVNTLGNTIKYATAEQEENIQDHQAVIQDNYAVTSLKVDGSDVTDSLDVKGTHTFSPSGLNHTLEATFEKALFAKADGWNVEGQNLPQNAGKLWVEASETDTKGIPGWVNTTGESRVIKATAKDNSTDTTDYELVESFHFDVDGDGIFEKYVAIKITDQFLNDETHERQWVIQTYGDNDEHDASITSWITEWVPIDSATQKKIETTGVEFKLVREGTRVRIYLDGKPMGESEGDEVKGIDLTRDKHNVPTGITAETPSVAGLIQHKVPNEAITLTGVDTGVLIDIKSTANGTFTVKEPQDIYHVGDTVVIQATGNEGYACDTIKINGKNVELDANGEYKLVLEKGLNIVSGTFKKSLFATETQWDVQGQHFGKLALTGMDSTQLHGLWTRDYVYTEASLKVKEEEPSLQDYAPTIYFEFVNGEKFAVRLNHQYSEYFVQVVPGESVNTFVGSNDWIKVKNITDETLIHKIQTQGIEYRVAIEENAGLVSANVYLDGNEQPFCTYPLTNLADGTPVDMTGQTARVALRVDGNKGKAMQIQYTLGDVKITAEDAANGKLMLKGPNDTDFVEKETAKCNIGEYVSVKPVADSGYTLKELYVDDERVTKLDNDGCYTFKVTRVDHTVSAVYGTSTRFGAKNSYEDTIANGQWDFSGQEMGVISVTNTTEDDNIPNQAWWVNMTKAVKTSGDYDSISAIIKNPTGTLTEGETAYGVILGMHFSNGETDVNKNNATFRCQIDTQYNRWHLQAAGNNIYDWNDIVGALSEEDIAAIKGDGLEFKLVRQGTYLLIYLNGKLAGNPLDLTTNKAGASTNITEDTAVSFVTVTGAMGPNKSMVIPFALEPEEVVTNENIGVVRTWTSADYTYPASELDVVKANFDLTKGDITYTLDEANAAGVTIDADKMTVKATAAGETTVTATQGSVSKVFTVKCTEVDRDTVEYQGRHTMDGTPDWEKDRAYAGYAEEYTELWKNYGVNNSTTMFIGDSFFDPHPGHFWTNFYTDYYPGKDALAFGVSSSTTHDWETFAESFLNDNSGKAPKNIAMHMGTNNVFDLQKTDEQTIDELQRMFYVIHKELPNTQIYWFTISHRTTFGGAMGEVSNGNDTIDKVNKEMQEWCSRHDWITCIATTSTLENSGELRDGVHPTLDSYRIFTEALAKTDIVMNDAGITFNNLAEQGSVAYNSQSSSLEINTTGKDWERTRAFLFDRQNAYVGNYMISGTVQIRTNGEADYHWAELLVSNKAEDLWYNDTTTEGLGMLGSITYTNRTSEIWKLGENASQGKITEIAENLTYKFTVIAYNGKVLFKINDTVVYTVENAEMTMENPVFAFGAEGASMTVTNIRKSYNDTYIERNYNQFKNGTN